MYIIFLALKAVRGREESTRSGLPLPMIIYSAGCSDWHRDICTCLWHVAILFRSSDEEDGCAKNTLICPCSKPQPWIILPHGSSIVEATQIKSQRGLDSPFPSNPSWKVGCVAQFVLTSRVHVLPISGQKACEAFVWLTQPAIKEELICKHNRIRVSNRAS